MEKPQYFYRQTENRKSPQKEYLQKFAKRVNLEPVTDPVQINDTFVIRNS